MRIIPVALATAAVLPLAGCGAGPATIAQAAGSPAISKAQAQVVLSAYQEANNQANGALNDHLLSTLETGPQLTMDAAAYKLHRVTGQPFGRIAFSNPVFYIPRLTAYPHWFVVDAVSPATAETPASASAAARSAAATLPAALRHALLFLQPSADAPWRLAADPFPYGTSSPLAKIALDKGGYAVPVAPDTKQLAIAPNRLGPAHAAVLTAGPSATGTAGLGAGPQTSQAYDALQQARSGFSKLGVSLTSQFTADDAPVYALRTTDGGALVWYVLRQREVYATSKAGNLSVTGDLIGLAPAGRVHKRLATTVLIQYLAKDPASGSASVTGMYRKAVQATES